MHHFVIVAAALRSGAHGDALSIRGRPVRETGTLRASTGSAALRPRTPAERTPIRPSPHAYFLTANTLASTESSPRKTTTL